VGNAAPVRSETLARFENQLIVANATGGAWDSRSEVEPYVVFWGWSDFPAAG